MAGPVDLAAHENRDGTHRAERNEDFGAQQRAPGRGLQITRHRCNRAPGGGDRRQRTDNEPAITVDPGRLGIIGGTLELDDDIVAYPDDIIVTNRTGQRAGGAAGRLEQVIAELLQGRIIQPVAKLALDRRRLVQAVDTGAGLDPAQFLFLAGIDAAALVGTDGGGLALVTLVSRPVNGIAGAGTAAQLALHLLEDTGINGLCTNRRRNERNGDCQRNTGLPERLTHRCSLAPCPRIVCRQHGV